VPTVPTPDTLKVFVDPVEINSLLNSLSVNILNLYPDKDESDKSNTISLFLIGFISGLINEINWEEPPDEVKSIVTGGFCWLSKCVSHNLNLLSFTLYTKYSSNPLSFAAYSAASKKVYLQTAR